MIQRIFEHNVWLMDESECGGINYSHVVPDSYFWTDLDQLILTLELQRKKFKIDGEIVLTPTIDVDYLITGLRNTLKHGYNLKQEI